MFPKQGQGEQEKHDFQQGTDGQVITYFTNYVRCDPNKPNPRFFRKILICTIEKVGAVGLFFPAYLNHPTPKRITSSKLRLVGKYLHQEDWQMYTSSRD